MTTVVVKFATVMKFVMKFTSWMMTLVMKFVMEFVSWKIALIVVASFSIRFDPPMFSTIARIGDASSAVESGTSTMIARITFTFARYEMGAMTTWFFDDDQFATTRLFDDQHFFATMFFAVIFSMSDQWARMMMTSRRGYRYAFLARTQMTRDGETRIGDALKLMAWVSTVARTMFG